MIPLCWPLGSTDGKCLPLNVVAIEALSVFALPESFI